MTSKLSFREQSGTNKSAFSIGCLHPSSLPNCVPHRRPGIDIHFHCSLPKTSPMSPGQNTRLVRDRRSDSNRGRKSQRQYGARFPVRPGSGITSRLKQLPVLDDMLRPTPTPLFSPFSSPARTLLVGANPRNAFTCGWPLLVRRRTSAQFCEPPGLKKSVALLNCVCSYLRDRPPGFQCF